VAVAAMAVMGAVDEQVAAAVQLVGDMEAKEAWVGVAVDSR
jgi:hypothetical protein